MSAQLRSAADRILYDSAHLVRLAGLARGGIRPPEAAALRRAAEAVASLAPGSQLAEDPLQALRVARLHAWHSLRARAASNDSSPGDVDGALESVREAALMLAALHPNLARDALAFDWLRSLPLPERLEPQRSRLLRSVRQRTRRLRGLR